MAEKPRSLCRALGWSLSFVLFKHSKHSYFKDSGNSHIWASLVAQMPSPPVAPAAPCSLGPPEDGHPHFPTQPALH